MTKGGMCLLLIALGISRPAAVWAQSASPIAGEKALHQRLPRRNLHHALFPVSGRAVLYADCAEERNPVAGGAEQIGAITAPLPMGEGRR